MDKLVGATVFFRGKGIIARIIQFGTLFQKRDKGFFRFSKYNHVGTVHEDNGTLMLLEAKYPRITSKPLCDVLNSTKDETLIKEVSDYYKGALAHNIDNFTAKCKSYIGKRYSVNSAIASGIDFPIDWKSSKGVHCSCLSAILYKEAGLLRQSYEENEATPDDILAFRFLK